MKDLRGRNALVTGAAGGIGHHIAETLADHGVNVVVSGRNRAALEALRAELLGKEVAAEVVTADLSVPSAATELAADAEAALGPIDLLVNNAGVGILAPYTQVSPSELLELMNVNLVSAMLLTRAILPGMLERERGHVVSMSSLAGKIPAAFNGLYAPSKAGLVALTQALRAEHAGSGVSFSAICPGFVRDEGIFSRAEALGFRAPRNMGTASPAEVADAVVDAIVRDRPEVIVNPRPVRPVFVMSAISAKAGERIVERSGTNRFMRELATATPPTPG